MKKCLNIVTALLLCTNIAFGSQDSAQEQLMTSKKVKPTDASGIILSSHTDSNHVSFQIQKVGYDWCAIAAAMSTLVPLAWTAGTIKTLATEKKCSKKDIAAIGSLILGLLITKYITKDHEELTHGQHWFKSAESHDLIELEKRNETWHVLSRSSKSTCLQKLSDPEAQQLAEAIIAQHNPDVKEQDLYTSPIFEQLVSNFFKAQGTK